MLQPAPRRARARAPVRSFCKAPNCRLGVASRPGSRPAATRALVACARAQAVVVDWSVPALTPEPEADQQQSSIDPAQLAALKEAVDVAEARVSRLCTAAGE